MRRAINQVLANPTGVAGGTALLLIISPLEEILIMMFVVPFLMKVVRSIKHTEHDHD